MLFRTIGVGPDSSGCPHSPRAATCRARAITIRQPAARGETVETAPGNNVNEVGNVQEIAHGVRRAAIEAITAGAPRTATDPIIVNTETVHLADITAIAENLSVTMAARKIPLESNDSGNGENVANKFLPREVQSWCCGPTPRQDCPTRLHLPEHDHPR